MKKIFAGVLTLILTMAMLSGACAETADITGEWYADLFGMPVTMTLKDGTYTLDIAGEAEEGTYSFDGTTLYMDEGTDGEVQMPYDAELNQFILDMGDGMIIYFGREAAAAFVPAAARTDSAIEEFAGEWTAVQVSAFGIVAPPDMIGIYMTAKVEGTAVTMNIDLMGDVNEFTIDAALVDGILTIIVPATEYTEEMTYTMQLLEDGMAAATFDMFGETVTFYLEKAA